MRPVCIVALLAAATGCQKLGQGIAVLTHAPTEDAAEAPAGRYTLDAAHSSVHFAVQHLKYSAYLGRFDEIDGTLVFVPEDPTQSRLSVTVRTASVNSGNATVDEALRDLFQADEHPQIRFESREIRLTGETTGVIRGEVTMAGRTHPLDLQATFNGGAPNPLTGVYTLGFSASATLQRSDWGLGKWVPAVSDDVTLRIEAEFTKAEDKPAQ